MYADAEYLELTLRNIESEFQLYFELEKSKVIDFNKIANTVSRDNAYRKEFMLNELNTALLIMSFNKLEHYLEVFCDQVAKTFNINIYIRDINNRNLNKFVKYLSGLTLFEYDAIKTSHYFDKWKKLRNNLVHNNADVDKIKSKILETLDVRYSFQLDCIQITERDCLKMINDIECFFNEIIKETRNTINTSNEE